MDIPETSLSNRSGRITIGGVRFIFTLMSFFGFWVTFSLRVTLNVAMVAMINTTAVYDRNLSTSSECPNISSKNSTTSDKTRQGEFTWSVSFQAIVLGAFYYGYTVTQICGGRMAELFSGKWVFGGGILINSILSLFYPAVARASPGAFVFVLVISGMAQGVVLPAMHTLLGRWMPETERGFLSTCIYIGINFGIAVSMPLTGLLCNSNIWGGWPSSFYFSGLLGCFWFLLWCIIVTESPYHHPCITSEELKYIADHQGRRLKHDHFAAPWKEILKSGPFWTVVLSQVANDYCLLTIISELPVFMDRALHMDIVRNSVMTSFPFILSSLLSLFASRMTDTAVKKHWLTLGFVRKTCNTLAMLGKAMGFVGVCLAGCNATIIMVSYWFAMAIGGLTCCGYQFALIDLSPKYAGTLMGITNTLSSSTGFIAPAVVAALTDHSETLSRWRIVFVINIGILLVAALTFVLYDSTKTQPWDSPSAIHPTDSSQNPVVASS